MDVRVTNRNWFMIVDDDDSVISIRVRRKDMGYPLAVRRARKVLREHGIKVAVFEDLGVREVSRRIFEVDKAGNARCWDLRFSVGSQNP